MATFLSPPFFTPLSTAFTSLTQPPRHLPSIPCCFRAHTSLFLSCLRRRTWLLAPFLSLSPLPQDRRTGAGALVDPLEQAIVDTLNVRDAIPLLCDDLTRIQLEAASFSDRLAPGRTLSCIYEILEISLPMLVEQYEIEEETVQQLLENLVYAQEAFYRSCLNSPADDMSCPVFALDNCLRLLKRASSQVDDLLEQLPTEIIELAQLVRGVRPTA